MFPTGRRVRAQGARRRRARARASAKFPHEVARKMAAAGSLGILLPEEDGGAGGTLMDAVLAIEQIAVLLPAQCGRDPGRKFRRDPRARAIRDSGSEGAFLKPLLKGDEVIAVAMTEPDAGSATTDLTTTATPDGKGFRISGTKVFPNPHADQYLVYVRLRAGCRRHRFGNDTARRPRLHGRQAVEIHVGQRMGAAVFRQRLRAA